MEENLYSQLVYLDHNVLDQMTKGDPFGICKLFENSDLIPVYSFENLNEIKRSKGYEDTFLRVLSEIEARYITPNMDGNFRHIGTAKVLERDPFEIYKSHIEDTDETPSLFYGLGGMLQKMYGGKGDKSFSEIFKEGIQELGDLSKIPHDEIDTLGISEEEKEKIKEYMRMLPCLLNSTYSELGEMLDKDAVENAVKDFERTTGLGPTVLKNIKSPNVLLKVWDKIQESMTGVDFTLEKFFGLDRSEWSNEGDRDLSVVEKVNSIYHQLNYVGYFRDSNMKKDRRFKASFSDMTHAGMATFCKIFICQDEDLVMKAHAAYEYLGLNTIIIYIRANNGG